MNSYIEHWLVSTLHRLQPDGQPIPHNRWQRALSSSLRRLIPALHQSPWMEWEYGTWVGAFAGYDELGRQLGEANVLPEWRATPLPDKWHLFKGPGIRQGHPFNIDAMHEMVNCWDDLLRDAATLREMHCRLHHRDHSKPLAAKDLLVITAVAVSFSSFLLRRGDAPTPDGALPRQAAAAFKVLGGMYAATNRMLSQAQTMLTQDTLDADVFLEYLETERLLLSPEMRACAGPVKMIQQILGAVINPPSDNTVPNGLGYLGSVQERAFAYGCLCIRIDLAVLLYWRSLRHYLKPLLHNSTISPNVRNALQQEPELGIEDDIPLRNYGEVARQILSLLPETDPDKAFIEALPLEENEQADLSLEAIGTHCYRLEMSMRAFARQLQAELDRLLQRQAPQLSEHDWSPAPGSRFLKGLSKMDTIMKLFN